MTILARETFERGTKTFNSHDIGGFAEVLADDVVFEAPGGLRGRERQPASNSTASMLEQLGLVPASPPTAG